MATLTQEKLKEMEAEMNRFEQEILAPTDSDKSDLPRMIIGVNTYHQVQAKLAAQNTPMIPLSEASSVQKTSASAVSIPLSVLTSPPPPPPPPSHASSASSQISCLSPPPPPPLPPPPMSTPSFVPPQLRHRNPMSMSRHPVHGPRQMHGQQFQQPQMSQMMQGPMSGPPQMCQPRGPPSFMQGPPNMYMSNSMEVSPIVSKEMSTIEKPKVVYSAPPIRSSKDTCKIDRSPNVGSGDVNCGIIQPSQQQLHEMLDDDGLVVDIDFDAEPTAVTKKEKREKKRKFVRTAAGQSWEDPTLSEWDADDFRIFCGDLGNEVTDEVLTRAFSKFPSFVKAKIVRDKRSNKTKGYGFVSFRDPNDFVRAMREMNGKYVGNRPIKLRKSTWKERNIEIVRKKEKEKKRLGLR